MATPIWNYTDNSTVETDKVELKQFKPVGKFFADTQTLIGMFKIVTHPSIRESSYRDKLSDAEKEVTALNFYKYRLDHNSLRVTSLALNAQHSIQTIK